MPAVEIRSEFGPMQTSYILQHVNAKCRMFKDDQPDGSTLYYSFEGENGTVHVYRDREPEREIVTVTFERERPTLTVVTG